MRLGFRKTAALLLSSTLAATASAQKPAAPPSVPAPNTPGATTPAPNTPGLPNATAPGLPSVAMPNEPRPTGIAAKVNGQEVPEVAVFRALRQFPAAEREVARREILNHLVENFLIDQYLTALKITADQSEVEKLISEIKDELKKNNREYLKELEGMMLTEAEFRIEVAAQMKWDKFVKQQGTDEALKKLYEASPQVFDGSMVRARHILMNPGSDPAKVEEAKKTLQAIKQTVENEALKAIASETDALKKEQLRGQKAEELFGKYAERYSTCPSKTNGGDLSFFPRVGAMVEPFAKTAFELPQYQISEVVQTEFGYHLIMCTAKKPGTIRKFEDVKSDVLAVYAMRLREAVIAQMKPKAQIELIQTSASTPAPTAGLTK